MYRIKKFKVLKMASFMGLYGVFIGLIMAIFSSIFSLLVGSLIFESSLINSIFGFWALLFFPIFYGITAFVGGLIFIPIMNLVLKIVKGVDLELEAVAVKQKV